MASSSDLPSGAPSVSPSLLQNPRTRFSLGIVALFLFAWMLPGLVGRDPWKADEAYSFGMVLEMIQTGHWVIPTLAGEPFMEKPPIMYVVSAISAKLFGGWLPLHDAARGSVVFFNALTFVCLGFTARLLYGRGQGWVAPVLLAGTIGLIHNQHMLITDVALLTGFALAHLGWVASTRCYIAGGLLAGTGLGVAFLAKGLLGPGLLGLTSLLLLCFRPWRTWNFVKTLLVMGVVFLPWAVVWPYLIYRESPALFHEWFWVNNVGRFLGQNTLGPSSRPLLFFRLLPWFAFPAIYLAGWTWWRERARWQVSPAWSLGAVSFGLMLAVLSASRQGRSLYAQPLLVPLVLAATPSVFLLGERWAKTWARLNLGLFVAVAGAAWFCWGALQLGWPAAIGTWINAKVPGYEPRFSVLPVLVAALTTAALAWRLRDRTRHSGPDVVFHWAALLGWAYLIAMTLYLPLANTNMGYRDTFPPLRDALPPGVRQIASVHLGEPQRGLLHYLAGLRTLRAETDESVLDTAEYVLIQGDYRSGAFMGPPARGEWDLKLEKRRGGRESFRLYQRRDAGHSPRQQEP